MDGDTTSRKGSYERILEDMKNKKVDILIGTQMISRVWTLRMWSW